MWKPLLKVMFSLLLTSVGATAQDGLLVHLKLNEAGGELAKDSSGNGHDGTLVGVAVANSQWVDGKSDNAVSLGIGHVAVTDLPEMTSTTWAAWVRLDADSPYGTAISAAFDGAGAGHTLGFHTGGNVRKPRVLWNHANGHVSIMSEEPVELGEWNHMAVTYDADSEAIVLYVNGEAKADGTVGTTAFSTVNLGRRASSKNSPLNGALDDVSIFDRGLTSDEIGDLFFGEDIDDGLVLSWEFGEEEGFACADSSGNGNDGSLVGYPAGEVSNWVEGKIGGALSLPQASEHLEITGLPDVTSTTWAAWVRLDAEASYSTAIAAAFDGAGAGHTLGFHAGDNIRKPRVLWNHANGHASIMSPDPVELGEWNHIAVTYDADSEAIVLYVNGEAKADGTVGTTAFSVVHLGQRASTKNYPFNGALDDFKIFSRALGSDEISSLAGSKPNAEPNLEEGLQAHWAFDESEGTEAKDSTDNENHGELFADESGNFPTWLSDGGKIGGALAFNGANHVEVPDASSIGADLVGGFSMSAWFKSNVTLGTTGGGSRMLEKGNSFFFLQWAGGGMNFLVKKGGSNVTTVIGDPIDADRWYHITGVFDGEEIHVYLDGRLKGSTYVGSNIDDAGLPLRIGSDDSGAHFDGVMDDVRIWNRPLTAVEIKLLSGVGITGPPVFVQQPNSETRVLGDLVTFNTEADGQIPIAYQWFKGDDPIAGANDSSLTLRDLSETDAGSYTVVATNLEGEATSDAAVLSVNTIKNPELLVHLLLDEKEGLVAADGSGNDFNGTLENFGSGNANWIEGHMEGGLKLEGQHVAVSELPAITSTTWAAWVRLDKEANYSTAIAATFDGAGAGHTLGFHANNNVRKPRVLWNHKNGHASIMSPDPVELGEWNHIAVTYDADSEEIVLYVNGESKADGTVGTTPFSVVHLGQRASTMNYPFNGGLDHVAIYDRALSSDEIVQLVSEESVNEGLLVLWDMNETTGLELSDTSGNGHDGVCSVDQSAFWVDGKAGGGLDFTPKSYVSVSGLPETLSTTWAVWVNLQSKPAYGTAIAAGFQGAGAGHSLGFHTGATAFHPRVLWNHALGHTSIMSPDPVKANEWVHLAVSYDGEAADGEHNLVLYVNGEEKASGAAKTTPFKSINLGQRESSKNAWIDAILDDARIYAKVLQSEDIKELYGSRTTGPPEFTSHPQSKALYSGDETFFSVAANGSAPISFQWFKDGEAIEGEDYEKLELMEITEDDAGVYHAVATNSEGSVASNNATLEVTVLSTETFGLVAQYDFEETSGMVANDSSGNEVHGNLMDFPEGDEHWVEGAFGVGKALRIQKPQYVEVNLPKMMTTVSLTAWVKPESEDNFQTIIGADFKGAGAGHIFGFRSSGPNPVHPRVLWNHGAAHTSLLHPEPTELGEWVHVALTYDSESKELNFYVDGEISSTANSESTTFMLVNIGRRVPTQNYWLTGVVDNIRIYDVVLPVEDIVAQAKRPPKVLEILSLSLAGEDQLDLVLKSPMPGREHIIQRKAHLSDEVWVDQADVSFSEPVGREITATFNRSADPASFYRAAVVLPKAIYLEDFESGAEGWEHGGTEDNWELGTPVNGPGSAFSGENVYATGLDSDYAPGTDSYLVSPEIDLTGVNVATLVFQEFRDVDLNPIFHNVVVNILDSDTLEVIEELSRRGGSTSQWKEVSFPLGQDSLNRKIRIEFRLSSDNFNPRQGWYLDDITILPE